MIFLTEKIISWFPGKGPGPGNIFFNITYEGLWNTQLYPIPLLKDGITGQFTLGSTVISGGKTTII